MNGDGQDCLINVTNGDFKNYPVEVFEHHYPIKVNRYEIRPDSGGPGKNRGGMGEIGNTKLWPTLHFCICGLKGQNVLPGAYRAEKMENHR